MDSVLRVLKRSWDNTPPSSGANRPPKAVVIQRNDGVPDSTCELFVDSQPVEK